MERLPDITASIRPTDLNGGTASAMRSTRNVPQLRPDARSLRQALAERMTLSEYLEAVSGILACYEYGARENGYIGALAQILMAYPRQIALRCADPLRGIARDRPDRAPNVGHVIAWCEQAQAPLHIHLREAEQVAARETVDRSQRPSAAQVERNLPDWMKAEKSKRLVQFVAAFPDPQSREGDRDLKASRYLVKALREKDEINYINHKLDGNMKSQNRSEGS